MALTKEELEDLYVSQLRNLAAYYGLDLPSRMLKADIVDAILEFLAQPEEEVPPMSVRVKRIKELNRS